MGILEGTCIIIVLELLVLSLVMMQQYIWETGIIEQ